MLNATRRQVPCNQRTFPLRHSLAVIAVVALMCDVLACGQESNPWEGYSTFTEIEQRLTSLAESPGVELESLGKTIEDRDIWLLKIGSD